MTFNFTTERRCISTCSLNYSVHIVTCLQKFIISCYWSILMNSYECNFLILIPQCSNKKIEYFKRRACTSWCKSKGVWSSRTYIHKSRGKFTYSFNVEKLKIHLKHKPRSKFQGISGWTSGNFSFLGQETNRSGLLYIRDIFCETSHESFSRHSF